MKLPLIILILFVIISISYVISSRIVKKREGYVDPLKKKEEDKILEPEYKGRMILSGTLESTKSRVKNPKIYREINKEKSTEDKKKKDSPKKAEKRKYTTRKKKGDKGDDLLLS